MIRDKLFEKSPYDDFDAQSYNSDMQGWGSDHPLLVEAIRTLRPRTVCEVGSWKGRSAINMARTVKEVGINTEIICVDTWLGSPEHWLSRQPNFYDSLLIKNGLPHLYYTFLSNVVKNEVADIITPFPTTSENAAVVFRRLGVRFDLVYIDAAHEYDPATRDITTYYDLLSDNGLLIGDDYIGWPGVTQAANDFVKKNRLAIFGTQGKFVIPKGNVNINIVLSAKAAGL